MSNSDEPQDEERERTREAVQIMRRLDENPEDEAARTDRAAFLKRGEKERVTYERTLRALGKAETSLRRNRNKRYVFALLGGLFAALALAWQPLKLSVLADFQSGRGVTEVMVASGDTIVLDAGSAISDETGEGKRAVTLLAGAGYFDIDTSERSFVVRVDDATVETLGTAFEVSRQGATNLVSVAEGAVVIRQNGLDIEVQASERIRWSETITQRLEPIDDVAVASWRDDVLDTDGMTVGEVAAIIDRRTPGSVVILTRELRSTIVSGRLDLSRPTDALRTLAVTVDADVIAAPPLGVLIRP